MKFALTSRDGKQAAVIEVRDWPGDVPAFLMVLREAVTNWLDTTPDGQRARLENKGKFSFADLAEYCPDCFLKGTSLGNCMYDAGIKMTTITIADIAVDADIVDVHVDSNLYKGGE